MQSRQHLKFSIHWNSTVRFKHTNKVQCTIKFRIHHTPNNSLNELKYKGRQRTGKNSHKIPTNQIVGWCFKTCSPQCKTFQCKYATKKRAKFCLWLLRWTNREEKNNIHITIWMVTVSASLFETAGLWRKPYGLEHSFV